MKPLFHYLFLICILIGASFLEVWGNEEKCKYKKWTVLDFPGWKHLVIVCRFKICDTLPTHLSLRTYILHIFVTPSVPHLENKSLRIIIQRPQAKLLSLPHGKTDLPGHSLRMKSRSQYSLAKAERVSERVENRRRHHLAALSLFKFLEVLLSDKEMVPTWKIKTFQRYN